MPYNFWADVVRLLAEQCDTKYNVKLGRLRSQLQASYVSEKIIIILFVSSDDFTQYTLIDIGGHACECVYADVWGLKM